MRRGLPRRLGGAGGGKAVCFHPVIEGTSTIRQPAIMGLCPKPRSLSNRGEWLRGKRPFPGARFPSWEPIAPSGLLGLLSSRALSVPAVSRTGNNGCEDARGIGDSLRYSTFAQFNSLHFCSARYRTVPAPSPSPATTPTPAPPPSTLAKSPLRTPMRSALLPEIPPSPPPAAPPLVEGWYSVLS